MSQQSTEKDNLPTQSDKTTKILETAEKIVDKFTKSETVELTEVAAKTTENIFTVLVTSGGKPVAVILAIAVLIVATAIPIVAMKLSPSQINQPTNNSHLTR
jgi:CHASE3 domain sensor protein